MLSAFVLYGTQRDPQYEPLYGQEKPLLSVWTGALEFEDVIGVNFDDFPPLNIPTLRNPALTAVEVNV